MVVAENMLGEKFKVPGPLFFLQEEIALMEGGDLPRTSLQPITVAKSIKRNQIWADPIAWRGPMASEIDANVHGPRSWKIKSIKETDDGMILKFVLHEEWVLDENGEHTPPGEAYKTVLQELDLSEDKLKGLIREMLINLFPIKVMRELLELDNIEFIMDDYWMYLKAGNTAYRV